MARRSESSVAMALHVLLEEQQKAGWKCVDFLEGVEGEGTFGEPSGYIITRENSLGQHEISGFVGTEPIRTHPSREAAWLAHLKTRAEFTLEILSHIK